MASSDTRNPFVSIVSPVYGAEASLEQLVSEITLHMSKFTNRFEIVLVEDGSPDKSWELISGFCKTNKRVKGIKLSRNFGQHYAISVGIDNAVGDYVVVMDCDLQDSPAYIEAMFRQTLLGFDIVYTSKQERKHSFFKNLTAKIFFRVFNYLSDSQSVSASVGNFSLMTKKVADAFRTIKDAHRHYLMILRILGFKSTFVEVEHQERLFGESSYTFQKLVKHAINGITSQTTKVLYLSIAFGFGLVGLAFIWSIILVFIYFSRGTQAGYTSLMAVLILSTGLIMISLGIVGVYVGKIFEQVKYRPLYIVDEKLNFNDVQQ